MTSHLNKFRRDRFNNLLGVTLIELLTVLSIISILLLVTGTHFGRFIEDSRFQKEQRLFVKFLKLARGEAISRGYPVTVCRVPNDTSTNCSTTSNTSSYWILTTTDPSATTYNPTPIKRISISTSQIKANVQNFTFDHTGHVTTQDPDNPNTFTANFCSARSDASLNQKKLEVLSSGIITVRGDAICT